MSMACSLSFELISVHRVFTECTRTLALSPAAAVAVVLHESMA